MTDQETAAPSPGLTIQDLSLALQIVQVATSRGAFKAEELSAVGGLYDRLFAFLKSSGALTTPATPEVAEPAASPVVTETAPAKKSKA